MKFNAEIEVMPLKALLDPQGKAVTSSMKNKCSYWKTYNNGN
jgi:phosphoribosylformylglycinamidine synthase